MFDRYSIDVRWIFDRCSLDARRWIFSLISYTAQFFLSRNFILIFNRFATDVRKIFDMFERCSMALGWFTGRCWLDARWLFDRMSIHCQERFAVHNSPCYSAIFQNLALLFCYIPEWGLVVYRSMCMPNPTKREKTKTGSCDAMVCAFIHFLAA